MSASLIPSLTVLWHQCQPHSQHHQCQHQSWHHTQRMAPVLALLLVSSTIYGITYTIPTSGITVSITHDITNSLWHGITNSLWHVNTNSLWYVITNSLWHGYTNSLWHVITSSLWHAIMNSLWHGINDNLWHGITNNLWHGITDNLWHVITNRLWHGITNSWWHHCQHHPWHHLQFITPVLASLMASPRVYGWLHSWNQQKFHGIITIITHDIISIRSGSRFNIKMSSYQYRKSYCGDKTVVRSSYFHNGISYTGKMTSLYWIKALVTMLSSHPNHKVR